MNIKIAERMEEVHSDIRGPIFVEANRMSAQGIDVLKLNTGNPATFGFKMPDSVRNALLANADKAVAYCDLKGMPEARRAIYDYHCGRGMKNFDPDCIFIGNGVSEVAQMVSTALFDIGDEILIPTPSYSLWTNLTVIAGAKPVLYLCDEKSNWYPDLDDIRSKITDRTRAIVIINPNNPTGALYPEEILLKIADIAREHELLIFSDEIYDRLVMDGKQHTSIAKLAPDIPVVTMNGLSKSHCLCGYRCGWMIISGPEHLTADYKKGIIQLTSMRLCANTLAQLIIPAAMADMETPHSMVAPGGRIYEQREATCSELAKIDGISFVKNSGAFYIFPKLDVKKFNITSDKKFAADLLHATNILLVPGSGFDWKDPDHFRIVMLPEAGEMREAIRKIGAFLDGYKQA